MHWELFFGSLAIIVGLYMAAWYLLARLRNRYDVVDSAWGLGFVLVAWASLFLSSHFNSLQIISAVLVSVWGVRLFAHITARNLRKPQDDHRYEALKQKWGNGYKLKMFTNVFMLQGLLILVVSAPMLAITTASEPPTIPSYIGWAIWLFGIGFEAVADRQLAIFLAHRPKNSHAIMQSGLWRYSRHPNYFGEVTAWWGAAVVAVSVGQWWGVIGAITITWLIVKVSGIPPLEKHYQGNTDYETYRARTSVLVPLPLRKSAL